MQRELSAKLTEGLSQRKLTILMETYAKLQQPIPLPPSIDALRALGSPSGRAGAKRLRGLTAPIPPTNYPQNHCTDSTHTLPTEPPHRSPIRNCIPLPTVCTTPLPLPSGGTSPHGARQEPCANFKQHHKPRFIPPSIDAHRSLGSPDGRVGAECLRGLGGLI